MLQTRLSSSPGLSNAAWRSAIPILDIMDFQLRTCSLPDEVTGSPTGFPRTASQRRRDWRMVTKSLYNESLRPQKPIPGRPSFNIEAPVSAPIRLFSNYRLLHNLSSKGMIRPSPGPEIAPITSYVMGKESASGPPRITLIGSLTDLLPLS